MTVEEIKAKARTEVGPTAKSARSATVWPAGILFRGLEAKLLVIQPIGITANGRK